MRGLFTWISNPSAQALATQELEATRKELLFWQSQLERRQHGVACLLARIRRLEGLTEKPGGM